MTSAELKEAISSLPSYPEWSEGLAAIDQPAAFASEPMGPDGKFRSIPEMTATEEAIIIPQAHLTADIARSYGAIPLPYRLGAVAVLSNRAFIRIRSENQTISRLAYVSRALYSIGNDDVTPPVCPTGNLYIDATRIGNILVNTTRAIKKERVDRSYGSQPIAQLTSGKSLDEASSTVFADYAVIPRGNTGLPMREPVISKQGKVPKVGYSIPRIYARPAYFDPTRNQLTVRGRSSHPPFVNIDDIDMILGRKFSGSFLLIGESALEFARQDYRRNQTATNQPVRPDSTASHA